MKNSKNMIILGLLIIVIGIIFLGNNLNLWNIEIFFDGWWTLFIIIPSLTGIIKRKDLFSSTLGLSIGVLLLLAAQNIIKWNMVGKIFIPLLLILIGISLILKPVKKMNNNNSSTYIGIFSSTEEKLIGKISNIKTIAIFGGVSLDLYKTKITKDISIDCVTIFGGTDIKVPDNVKVKTSGVPVFGGIENLTNNNEQNNEPTIHINYVCIFGGIDIK